MDRQQIPVYPFWKEPTTEVDIRNACTMVIDTDPVSDPASDLLLSTVNMIALGAKYHLSCPGALADRAQQHSYGNVIRKKEKQKNITANLLL